MYEWAYTRALEAVAMGETREDVREYLTRHNRVPQATADRAMADALHDADANGIDREDIDPSWFVRS